MGELQDLFDRYQRMGRVAWLQFALGQDVLMVKRGKLTVQIAAVNAFIAGLNMTTLERMEPMLEKIFYYLDKQARGSLDRLNLY
jgi:hypothetical protein